MACSAVRVRVWIGMSALVVYALHVRFEAHLLCVCVCVCVLQHCLMTVCSSTLSELGLQLMINLLALRDSSYWLVRTELLETLAEMDFR